MNGCGFMFPNLQHVIQQVQVNLSFREALS